jgi:hypothetical protein
MRICKNLFLVLIVPLAVSFLGISQAYGMAGHGNHHHQVKPVSPFDAKDKSAHCLLHGHSLDKPCPHKIDSAKRDNEVFAIDVDCGGSPFPKNPALTSVDFPSIDSFVFFNFGPWSIRLAGQPLALLNSKVFDTSSPPPKFL